VSLCVSVSVCLCLHDCAFGCPYDHVGETHARTHTHCLSLSCVCVSPVLSPGWSGRTPGFEPLRSAAVAARARAGLPPLSPDLAALVRLVLTPDPAQRPTTDTLLAIVVAHHHAHPLATAHPGHASPAVLGTLPLPPLRPEDVTVVQAAAPVAAEPLYAGHVRRARATVTELFTPPLPPADKLPPPPPAVQALAPAHAAVEGASVAAMVRPHAHPTRRDPGSASHAAAAVRTDGGARSRRRISYIAAVAGGGRGGTDAPGQSGECARPPCRPGHRRGSMPSAVPAAPVERNSGCDDGDRRGVGGAVCRAVLGAADAVHAHTYCRS
jgi:hypothetical protein